MSTLEQSVPWFATETNFTQTIRMRRARRSLGRHYAEHLNTYYIQARDLAKQARVLGEFTTDLEGFVESYGGHVPTRDEELFPTWAGIQADLWDALRSAGLVTIDGNPDDIDATFRVRVVDFEQTNRGRSDRLTDDERRARDAERKRRQRAAQASADVRGHDGRTNATTCNDEEPDTAPDTSADKTPPDAGNVRSVRQTSADTSASALTGQDRTRQDRTLPPTPTDTVDPAPPEVAEKAAPSPRSIDGRIRRYQRDLGALAFPITELIALRASDRGHALTRRAELDAYWQPAAELLAEHGPERLTEALNAATKAGATSMQYVATVAGRLQREAIHAKSSDPDLAASGDWQHLTPSTDHRKATS